MPLGLLLAFAGGWAVSAANSPPESAMPVPVMILAAAPGGDATAQDNANSAPGAETQDENPASVDSWSMLFVFVLSTFIGMGVIGRVSRLLHTPLMSLTNAISAIAIVGSIMVAGSDYPAPIRFLGAIAVFASMTNIVSGFLITDRMLKMFRRAGPSAPAVATRPGPAAGSSPPTAPPAK